MSAERFANLMSEALRRTGIAKSVSARYCQDGDMTYVGGAHRDDKGPLEIANGEEERAVRELWNAFYEHVGPLLGSGQTRECDCGIPAGYHTGDCAIHKP